MRALLVQNFKLTFKSQLSTWTEEELEALLENWVETRIHENLKNQIILGFFNTGWHSSNEDGPDSKMI
jgi:hypothetical protein